MTQRQQPLPNTPSKLSQQYWTDRPCPQCQGSGHYQNRVCGGCGGDGSELVRRMKKAGVDEPSCHGCRQVSHETGDVVAHCIIHTRYPSTKGDPT